MLTCTDVIGASEKAKILLKSTASSVRRSQPDYRQETEAFRGQTNLMCVDLRTRPSGSVPGCMY